MVSDPEVDIVVEAMGGVDLAYELVRTALEQGKHVVTANKALLATHGGELVALAQGKGVRLEYEAAVAGAIPIVKPLRESLAGDRVRKVLGILNGTTNFILTKMAEEGARLRRRPGRGAGGRLRRGRPDRRRRRRTTRPPRPRSSRASPSTPR